MKEIPLSKGKKSIVDDYDYEYLSQWHWHYTPNGYAMRRDSHGGYQMHRVIMNTPNGYFTDHINGNKLDNRRINLRICTPSQNNMNSKLSSRNTTGHKGIYFDKKRNRWRAVIRANKIIYRIGYFINIADAIIAYENKAKELFGEFYRVI